jgi:hypothetical protein
VWKFGGNLVGIWPQLGETVLPYHPNPYLLK